jgi:hypothetical protein
MRYSPLFLATLLSLSILSAAPVARGSQNANQKSSTVRSLEDLDQAKTFRDLAAFGLTAPDQRNHRAGTNLIMLAMQATPIQKGDWFKALALLGTEMIDVDLHTRLAYKTLFETGWRGKLDDIADTAVSGNAFLLLGSAYPVRAGGFKLPTHRSLIARRETAILALVVTIRERYTYDSAGNYALIYDPAPSHPANPSIRSALQYGVAVYGELKAVGITDQNLGAAIGVAAASLQRDRVTFESLRAIEAIGQIVTYGDALRGTFEQMRELQPKAVADFLPELRGQLSRRSLIPSVDTLLLPPSDETHGAILKAIRADLAQKFDTQR